MPTMSVRDVPPTQPKYRLKRSITLIRPLDPAQIFRGVSLGYFLEVAWNRYSTLKMSVQVVPPPRPEHRLKKSITFDRTTGSRSNF